MEILEANVRQVLAHDISALSTVGLVQMQLRQSPAEWLT
jgi:hypothetical protein